MQCARSIRCLFAVDNWQVADVTDSRAGKGYSVIYHIPVHIQS